MSTNSAVSGPITFSVKNSGDQITEFYVLGGERTQHYCQDGEHRPPGSSRDLTRITQPGNYFTVCKPGMVGAGIDQQAFTVSGEAVVASGDDEEAELAAVASYTAYVKSQTAELLPLVEAFVAA